MRINTARQIFKCIRAKIQALFNLPFFALIIVFAFTLIFTTQYSWKGLDGKGYMDAISSDGVGYYMYLPNIFINKSIANQKLDNRFILEHHHRGVNKCYVGTAIAMSPFFAAAYVRATSQSVVVNGYSAPFQKAISFAGLFYLLVGLFFLIAFLKLYQIRNWIIATVVLLIVFGTNLLTYAVIHPSMSHIYSFAFICAFLFYSKKTIVYLRPKYLYVSILLLALVVLIRPLNGLVLLIVPFLSGSLSQFKSLWFFVVTLKRIAMCSAIFFAVLFIQSFMWYVQSGSFFVHSYQDEGFYFLNPQIWNVLFSFRKGLFIYTPLLLLSMPTLILIYKKNRFAFFSLLSFFVVLVYFISSWWIWYYGPSFGQRPFVEFYALPALLIAILLQSIRSNMLKILILTVAALFVVLNLIQNYQYHTKILSAWDMNFEKYKYVFLKTSPHYRNILGGNNDIILYKASKQLEYEANIDFVRQVNTVHFEQTVFDSVRNKYVCDYSGREFNLEFNIPVDSSLLAQRGLFALISLDRLELQPYSCTYALLVIHISNHEDESYYYYPFPINQVPSDEIGVWKNYSYSVQIYPLRDVNDTMKIYVWNKKRMPFYLDNVRVSIYSMH
jgi:hypothetical protein